MSLHNLCRILRLLDLTTLRCLLPTLVCIVCMWTCVSCNLVEQSEQGVRIYGDVERTRQYAAYGLSSHDPAALMFEFLLPMTALAWRRVGYHSVIVVVGQAEHWTEVNPRRQHVLQALQELDAVIVFVPGNSSNHMVLSHVGGLFVGSLVRQTWGTMIDDVYLVTSHPDVWPLNATGYKKPPNVDIVSTNSYCCGTFSHRDATYRMLPITNIGATVRVWNELTTHGKCTTSPYIAEQIFDALEQEFGSADLQFLMKSKTAEMNLSQMLLSILVNRWVVDHGESSVYYVARTMRVDRMQDDSWSAGNSLADKQDVIALLDTYVPDVWVKVVPLLKAMYEPSQLDWCLAYHTGYLKAMENEIQF